MYVTFLFRSYHLGGVEHINIVQAGYNNNILSNTNSSVENGNGDSGTDASSSSLILIGGIVGGVLGGLILLFLIGLFPCIFLRRRRLRLQEKHRQQKLDQALKGASALGPYSQRASGIVSPGVKVTSPGEYDVRISGGTRMSVGPNHAPVIPPIKVITSGRNSPYTHGADWGGGGSTRLTPQARDIHYTHAVGVTGPQITTVPNAVSGR